MTDRDLANRLLAMLIRMEVLHVAIMHEANHRDTAWTAETIKAMNEVPVEARQLIATAFDYLQS